LEARGVNRAEKGSVVLVNTKQYPFNDSVATVALKAERADRDYFVFTEVLSAAGEVGDVIVSAKAVNGFKLAYTGSAERAEIGYQVTGGGQCGDKI
jgi:D-serine deaminase-like pyridoxal phosphate-dependent protein